MSHSGNNPSRRLQSLHKLQAGGREPGGEQFYNPSVFRYKCFGYLQLNSEDKGSYGKCRGYQSRMERVANMVPDTREGAIKKFLDASADLGTYVDSDDNSSDQKVKEIFTARTMIYKEDESKKWSPRIQPVKSSPFPEDELINKTEWSCWGSTSVHYLVLEPIPKMRRMSKRGGNPSGSSEEAQKKRADEMYEALTQQLRGFDKNSDQQLDDSSGSSGGSTKSNEDDKNSNNNKENPPNNKKNAKEVVQALIKRESKIASTKPKSFNNDDDNGKVSAITPENFGISIRKIDSSVGHFTVTDIGSLRICMESSASLMDDDNTNNNNTRNSNNNNNNNNKQASQQEQLAAANQKNNDNGDQGQSQNNGEEQQGGRKKPSTAMDLKKFYEFTIKVAHQMEYNCKEIREATRDEFPGRMYRFGTKVVNRFQKTSEQTFTYMGKILNNWWRSM